MCALHAPSRFKAAPGSVESNLLHHLRPAITGRSRPFTPARRARPAAERCTIVRKQRLPHLVRPTSVADPAASDPAHQQQDSPHMGSAAEKRGVVIVGGGPAGLSAALMLARRGWRDITVVEQQESVTFADPDRSYVYCIDSRGRKFVERYDLYQQLKDSAVPTMSMDLNMVQPTGKINKRNMTIKDESKVTHWLPRPAFMQLLADALQSDPAAAREVKVLTNTQVKQLEQDPSGKLLVQLEGTAASSSSPAAAAAVKSAAKAAAAAAVEAEAGSSPPPQPTASSAVATAVADPPTPAAAAAGSEQLEATLVLGCDGIKSLVRKTLASWAPGSFDVLQFPSLSSGIRYKVLQLPPNPATADGTVLPNSSFAVLVGRPTKLLPGAPAMRLGLLPVRDPAAGRTANLNVLPDHPIWAVQDAETMYAVFEDAFPQMRWRELVPQHVMEAYAASRGGTFPPPQHSTALTWSITPGQGHQQQQQPAAAGVVLLGDSAHCFPPDLGQGVNASLEDVCELEAALEEAGDRLAEALPRYQQRRQEDTAALARLVQVGYPLQYNQYPLRRKLWFLQFSAHLLLSKLLPFLVAPPLFMRIQDGKYSYSTIWREDQRSSTVLKVLAVALVAGLAWAGARVVRAAATGAVA